MKPTNYSDAIKIARHDGRIKECAVCRCIMGPKHKFYVKIIKVTSFCICLICAPNYIDENIQKLKGMKQAVKTEVKENINLYTLLTLTNGK